MRRGDGTVDSRIGLRRRARTVCGAAMVVAEARLSKERNDGGAAFWMMSMHLETSGVFGGARDDGHVVVEVRPRADGDECGMCGGE